MPKRTFTPEQVIAKLRQITTPEIRKRSRHSVQTNRCHTCLKALRTSTRFFVSHCTTPPSRIHYKRPKRRIGLCWEATRAPTSGPRPGWGLVKDQAPAAKLFHWDWHQSDKSQGAGDGVPRSNVSFLFVSTSFRPFRSFSVSVLSSHTCLRLQLLHEPIPLTGCRNHYSALLG